MIILLLSITFNAIQISGSSLSDQVDQKPADIYSKPGENAKITCSHSITSYNRILWYKQSDNQLQFLGYMLVVNGNPEDGVNVKMEGSANKDQNCTLTIPDLTLNSSAVYFCAASSTYTDPAYFGQGTKLTVLEPGHDITTPTVKVLPPSKKECKGKDNKRKKTLVCVASKFYPDHVSITWKINGETISKGVATDNAALRLGKYYKITSRLRVSAKEWFTPDRNFTCIVNFYNGKNYDDYSDSIFGVEAEDTGSSMTREKYLKITQMGKLSYGIFIAKSSLYGAFVLFLVWKLQGSKRNR